MEERRLIDANAAIENADKRYSEWNLAMAAAEGNRQISMVYKKQELFKAVRKVIESCPPVDPESLRPVAHWEEIPGSCVSSAGKSGSWCVPATRCTNPKCGEINPCGLKTPFCPMCGSRMEDVPYDDD